MLTEKVSKYYRVEGQLAFLHVNLLDNRSEFLAPLKLRVFQEGDHFVIEAFGAVAIANSIAYISELLDPISIVLGLTRRTLMKQSLVYLLFGEGETGLLVYSILVRYWEAIKRTKDLPLLLLVSEAAYRDAREFKRADRASAIRVADQLQDGLEKECYGREPETASPVVASSANGQSCPAKHPDLRLSTGSHLRTQCRLALRWQPTR